VVCYVLSQHWKLCVHHPQPRQPSPHCPFSVSSSLSPSPQLAKEEDFEAILKQEEEHIAKMCADILAFKPDLVIVSALHALRLESLVSSPTWGGRGGMPWLSKGSSGWIN